MMSVRLQPPTTTGTSTPRRRHSITRPSNSNSSTSPSASSTTEVGMPIIIPPSLGDPSSSASSATSLNNINMMGMINPRPKISRAATTTYGKQQEGGRLAVLVEDVDGVGMGPIGGMGSSMEPGLTRTRSRSRGISITSTQNPLISEPVTMAIGSEPGGTKINTGSSSSSTMNHSNLIGGPSSVISNNGHRPWNKSAISTGPTAMSALGLGLTTGGQLSPIPQSPAMPGSPQFDIQNSYPPQPLSSTGLSPNPSSSSSSTFPNLTFGFGLGPPPSSSSSSSTSASSSKNTLTPQDRRKGLTRRISSPTMRGSVPVFVVPGLVGVGSGAGTGGTGGTGGLVDEGISEVTVPGLNLGSSNGQSVSTTRTPSRLQYGYAVGGSSDVGSSFIGPSISIGDEGSSSLTGTYALPSTSGQVPCGSGSGSGSTSGLSTYDPYQVRPRSTSVNGFADANFGSPTTAAAAGGILGGFWLAGTALLGTMIGGSNMGYSDLSGGTEGNDVEFDPDTGRALSMHAMGKRRSQGSDSEGEKGYITPPLAGQEARVGMGGGWINGSRGVDQAGYFSLAPSDSFGDSGGTLPTPALSSASLSGRLDAGTNSSPSKQRRRRGTSSAGQQQHHQPFSSLRNFFFDIGAGLGGPSSTRPKHSPAPSPATSPPLLNIIMPADLIGSEKRQVRTRGNSSAVKRPEGLPQVSFQSQSTSRVKVEAETVPLLEALRETIKDMGWTLGLMGLVFVSSLGIVALLLRSLPIHSLKSLPKKVSDIQILSAEIRSYMASGSRGWWHVILTLIITGCWKHSWSVPGAVILNILVGSLMKPIPAVILLTVITSLGSLGAYTLSRPLAPLIGLVFPKPLALVRTAISGSSAQAGNDVNAMADTYELPSNEKPTVWRRLLVMRAMGVVPWSGMNVACGVVGVNWMTFVLTTAAGSASWSYVTANVGDILSQLALPKDAVIDGFESSGSPMATGTDTISGGQSLSGLLRDPALIAKLIILSLLSLLPVLFKSRSDPALAPPPQQMQPGGGPNISLEDQASTPLAPTPSVYYIAASLRHLTKGAIRGVESLWRTGWLSLLSLGMNDQATERIATSGR